MALLIALFCWDTLTYKFPVRITRQNDSFVIGNCSSLYTSNCSTTIKCKFSSDRGIDVFEVDLIETEAILFGFER